MQRVAVVTGANRGIGLEVCRELAAQGYRVVLTSRDRARGEAAVAELQRVGGDLIHHPLEVTDQRSVDQLRQFVVEQIGRIDVLINNAAIYPTGDHILTLDLARLRQTIETNVYGPLMLCQAFAPIMQRQRYGRIVNVSSGAGQLSTMTDDTPAYNMSKAALNAITRMVADAVGGSNVLVNSVCPGWVRTDMGGAGAPRSVAEGADTIVWLATLPDGGPSGGFFRDRQPIPW